MIEITFVSDRNHQKIMIEHVLYMLFIVGDEHVVIKSHRIASHHNCKICPSFGCPQKVIVS